ncbi:MAG: beta-phosphoglucomutase [Sphaerochaetaceae bacterium]|jgi:beta-phosphoglucomutase
MMVKACIFDLDGVLCHTDEFHYLAWKRISDELGLGFDRTLNEQLRGVSRRESFEIILRYNGIRLPEETIRYAMDKKNMWYREYLLRMSPSDLDSDVRPTLVRLHELGLLLAVGSSSRNARLILDRLGITGMFDAIVDGAMISNSKPDPEVFLKASKSLAVQPSGCVVIEDALSGIEAAKAGGMNFIAYRLHDPSLEKEVLHAENFGEILKLVTASIRRAR